VKEFAVYTAARLGLFVLAYAVILGLSLALGVEQSSGVVLLEFVVAVVLSAIGSVYLLRGPRERFALVVQRRAEAASARLERSRSKEDEPEA
jgi:hypothetical protein